VKRLLLARADIWIIIGILVAAFIMYMVLNRNRGEAYYARIIVDGHHIDLNLSRDSEFILPQNPQVRFKVADGRVAFIASDCPDQICVNRGFLRLPGQQAACLPNRVALIIIGPPTAGGPDIIAS